MNPTAIHHALHDADLKGTPRMALLVMALHADHRGRVQIGYRDLARMCGVSPQAASDAVSVLRGARLTHVVEAGGGSAPSVYQLLTEQHCRAPTEAKPRAKPTLQPEKPQEKAEDAANFAAPSVKVTEGPTPPPSVKLDTAPPLTSSAPETLKQFDIPAWAPQSSVGRVLVAARVRPHPDQPLYWFRKEHAGELEALCIAARVTVDQLCTALSKIEPQPLTRRMRDLAEALRKGSRA